MRKTFRQRGHWLAATVLVLTVAQLVVATAAPDLPQFAGKGFAARLFAYPAMMLVAPVVWWLASGRPRDIKEKAPWVAFAWIMLPFLIDVTGNTLDLYDSVVWWDDANHLVNWFFLNLGIGMLLSKAGRGSTVLMVGGLGAILAIGWELGEYFAFIRAGTELGTAYEDTLGDLALGTLGALAAGLVLARTVRRPVPVRELETAHQ